MGAIRLARREPVAVTLLVLLLLGLGVFLVLPIGIVVVQSIYVNGALTLGEYAVILSERRYLSALLNTVQLGVITSVLTTAVALCFAVPVTQSPSRRWGPLRAIALLPILMPIFLTSIALVILGGRSGLIPRLLNLDWSVYGWPGIVTSQLVHFLPMAYLMVENVLLSQDPAYEAAAADLGASRARTLWTIVIPLARPGIIKAALLVFLLTVSDFANPFLIGPGVPLLATEIYELVVGQFSVSRASGLAVFLLIISLAVFALHKRLLRVAVTMTSTSFAARSRSAGFVVLAPMLLVAGSVALLIVSIFAVVVYGAFVRIPLVNNAFTLEHFRATVGLAALVTSLKMAGYATVIGSAMGIVLAYLLARIPFPGRGAVEFLAMMGFAVPGTVVGLGYLLAFNTPPIVLVGTFLILVLNTAFRELSVGLQAGLSKLGQLDPAIEEASRDLGARTPTTFLRVVLPIIGSAVIAGGTFTFMAAMTTVSAVIFLIGPGTNLASLYILQHAQGGYLGSACAMSLILIAVVTIALGVTRGALRRSAQWTVAG